MYSGSGTILFTYLNFTLLYNTSYTGYRYTSSDNYEYLQPYWLTNLSFNYQTKIAKHAAIFFVRCNNVLNENYQVVKNYPTPLRNYNFGIQLNLNYNKHE